MGIFLIVRQELWVKGDWAWSDFFNNFKSSGANMCLMAKPRCIARHQQLPPHNWREMEDKRNRAAQPLYSCAPQWGPELSEGHTLPAAHER